MSVEKVRGKAQGALFTLESSTGLCTAVERVEIR